jgi:hypothetical protein
LLLGLWALGMPIAIVVGMDIHSMWNLYVGHCCEIGVSFEHKVCHAISVHQVGAHATLHTFDDNYDRYWSRVTSRRSAFVSRHIILQFTHRSMVVKGKGYVIPIFIGAQVMYESVPYIWLTQLMVLVKTASRCEQWKYITPRYRKQISLRGDRSDRFSIGIEHFRHGVIQQSTV